ncbi:MAG: secretin N-terminal domain-containing protein [Candidatus Binatia bacterium]
MKNKNAIAPACSSLVGGLIAVGLLTLMGCAPAEAPAPTDLTPPKTPPARAEKPSKKALPGLIVTEIERKREPERLYSFSVRDADIHEVLLAISKQTSFNIVADPDVQGSVTVDLKNVTLSEALDTLTNLLNLTYRVKRNMIRVSIPKPETRIFSLQYVNLKRTGSSVTSAQIGAAGGGNITRTGVGAVGAGGGAVGAGDSGRSTVTTSNETDLWEDIEDGLENLLSPEGKVVIDRQSGNILVTDFPKFLDRIAIFLESVEGSVHRQVLIEARILEVELEGEYRFGIDWSAVAKAGALQGNAFGGRIFSQSLAPAEATDFQIGVTSTDFESLLNILSTQGEVNVLSSPKLATLNNQTAILRSATDDVFFIVETERVPIQGGGFDSIRTVTPRTVTIGVVLAITPQIDSDRSVTLHVRPTVSRSTEDASITVSGEGDQQTEISVPIIDVREADVIVRAREGQVVVIGGLMQDTKSDDESKVPLLGDLPGIGRLFRQTVQKSEKSELVVLLRTIVLVGKKTEEITAQTLERLGKLKGASPW